MNLSLPSILSHIENHGYSVTPNFLDPETLRQLSESFEEIHSKNLFQDAHIGRNKDLKNDPGIRNDKIFWIENTNPKYALIEKILSLLRTELNSYFYLNINSFEAHFAYYEKNSFYQKHFDRHPGTNNRILTFILYLNPEWSSDDGGELVIYSPEKHLETNLKNEEEILKIVSPCSNTFVLFRSELFPHEVKLSLKPRKSLTGWFRHD